MAGSEHIANVHRSHTLVRPILHQMATCKNNPGSIDFRNTPSTVKSPPAANSYFRTFAFRRRRRFLLQSVWIGKVHRVPTHIGIEVHPSPISDGITLHEPAARGIVHPGLVIPQAMLRQPDLAGVSEPPQIVAHRTAIVVIFVELVERAVRAAVGGDGDDAAPLVGVQVAAVIALIVPDQRLVHAGTVHVAMHERGVAIFLHQRQPVIAELEPPGRARQPQQRVVLQGIAHPRLARQQILAGISERVDAVAGQIAPRVVREPAGGDLVAAVMRVGPAAVRQPRIAEQVVRACVADDLARRIVGEPQGHVAGAAVHVLGQLAEPRHGVVAVALRRAIAVGQAAAPAQIVINYGDSALNSVARRPRLRGARPRPVSRSSSARKPALPIGRPIVSARLSRADISASSPAPIHAAKSG